jgi:hypothetical protein
VLIHGRKSEPCPVCGGPCTGFPDPSYLEHYPFLPGGEPVRRPDMPNDVTVTTRIFYENQLVAIAGDRINAEDAKRWGVGPDGTQNPPPEEPTPIHAEKHPTARTRAPRRGERR